MGEKRRFGQRKGLGVGSDLDKVGGAVSDTCRGPRDTSPITHGSLTRTSTLPGNDPRFPLNRHEVDPRFPPSSTVDLG